MHTEIEERILEINVDEVIKQLEELVEKRTKKES